jgi:hypothetical protein
MSPPVKRWGAYSSIFLRDVVAEPTRPREPTMPSRLASQSFVATMAAPPAPSWWARNADMTRNGFIGLMAGWCSVLVLILAVSAFIRFIG